MRQLEARVMALVEESCLASCRNEDKLALDRAKEASAKERTLIRHREQAGLIDSHNLELTFVVSRWPAAVCTLETGIWDRRGAESCYLLLFSELELVSCMPGGLS